MVGRGGSSVPPYASRFDGGRVAELLGSDLGMAGVAEVARVLVDILAAQGEWLNVVDDFGQANDIAVEAPFAEAVGTCQPARSGLLPGSSAEALAHAAYLIA